MRCGFTSALRCTNSLLPASRIPQRCETPQAQAQNNTTDHVTLLRNGGYRGWHKTSMQLPLCIHQTACSCLST